MPKAVCTSCGHEFRFSADDAGSQLQCPECGEDVETQVRRGRPSRASRQADDRRLTYEAPQATSRVALGLGLASLIVGVMALPANWIPGSGKLGLVVSAAALLLGLAGLGVSAVRQGDGLAFPIAGSAVALVAFGLAVSQLTGLLPGPGALPQPVALVDVSPRGEEPRPTKVTGTAEADKAQPAMPELPWFDVSKGPYQVGELRLHVGYVIVGRVKEVLIEQEETREDYLKIQIFIENLGKTRKVDYKGWANSSAETAPLADNFENPYRRKEPGVLMTIIGQVREAKSIYPGERLEDLLVFEKPLRNVKYLRLELPLAALGGTGTVRLQLPATMIRR